MLCTPVLYSFIIKEESWMELIASAALLIKNLKTRKQSRKMEIKKCLNLNVHKTNAERSPQEGRAHHSHLIMALMEHFFGICVSSLPLPFVDVLFAGSLFFLFRELGAREERDGKRKRFGAVYITRRNNSKQPNDKFFP